MTENADNLVLDILKDIQMRMGHLDKRMANLELRMTAQEQHLVSVEWTVCFVTHQRLESAHPNWRIKYHDIVADEISTNDIFAGRQSRAKAKPCHTSQRQRGRSTRSPRLDAGGSMGDTRTIGELC